ncbi:hypothetical protein B9Z19DRAFT_1162573 [Tuber borchii]|uniref:Uncharacterized protein n=1 Tax=Tuber borchii TaxID=42251 RepID=A0A2T6ZDM0_TUBBO|nr:hypothetical protein B9Z19DRAFT_1162573 [Tuber borchii]
MPVPSPTTAIPPNPASEIMVGKAKEADSSLEKSSLVAERILSDILSAGTATVLVSPVIYLIDRSIIENASGRSSSVLSSAAASLKTLFKTPHRFFFSKPFALIYMTYFGTYLTANSIDTASSLRSGTDLKTVTAGTEKFPRQRPQFCQNVWYWLSQTRPIADIHSLFDKGRHDDIFFVQCSAFTCALYAAGHGSHLCSDIITEYVIIACQILSTPLHLTGLDIYNRQDKATIKSRWEAVKKNWAPSAVARMCRIIPAFGFGGVANAGIRRSLLEKVEKRGR